MQPRYTPGTCPDRRCGPDKDEVSDNVSDKVDIREEDMLSGIRRRIAESKVGVAAAASAEEDSELENHTDLVQLCQTWEPAIAAVTPPAQSSCDVVDDVALRRLREERASQRIHERAAELRLSLLREDQLTCAYLLDTQGEVAASGAASVALAARSTKRGNVPSMRVQVPLPA